MSDHLWTYDEFLCFLLIYVSYADIEFDELEQKAIQNLFNPGVYQKQILFFENLTDYQALNEIMQYRDKYFSTAEQKKSLLDKVEKQFSANGIYSNFEKEAYQFLEKIL